jgi:hypothetical protein
MRTRGDVNAALKSGQLLEKKLATLIFQSCMSNVAKHYRTGGKEMIKVAQIGRRPILSDRYENSYLKFK